MCPHFSNIGCGQGYPQALPILPIGYFFFNEIPKLGQKFLLSFPFLGVLRIDYSYGFPDQGVSFTVDLLSSFTHRQGQTAKHINDQHFLNGSQTKHIG